MIGNKAVYFLQVFPIYKEEMDFGNSSERFATLFKNSGIPEFTKIDRKNLCEGKEFEEMAKGTFCKNCGTVIRDIDPLKKEIKCPQCGEPISLKMNLK